MHFQTGPKPQHAQNMKTNTIKILILGIILSTLSIHVQAQIQYNGCSVTGTYASAIGKNNKATGNNSFAGGYNSQSAGSNSFAFGYNSKATSSTTTALGNTATASGTGSMAIGNYVKATGQNAFVFGSGTTASYPLTNSTDNSIAFGVNSNKPTMRITKSLNNNYTGKVAIGQVDSPEAKLHLKSDSNEDAGVFIEPSNTNNYKAFIKLFDKDHSITVDKTAAMELNSGTGSLLFKGTSYCFGNGKIGIGSNDTYLENTTDNTLKVVTPNAMDLQSEHITLSGKIGVNTVNNANGYALAVDGGIVSTKIYIKEVKLWPDYVFTNSYRLMSLKELQLYLDENHHLPGIPSEADILRDGYDLNEMQSLMMEKIEELTRYILLLQDEINEIKAKTPSGDSIVFSYDSNGNRISRSLQFQRIPLPDRFHSTAQPVSYELFPNPTPGVFSIQINEQGGKGPFHATLLTLNGVIIEEKDITEGNASFDLSGQADGVYLLEIDGPEGHHSWKVIKR